MRRGGILREISPLSGPIRDMAMASLEVCAVPKSRHSAIAPCSSASAETLADRWPKLWVRRTAGDWLHCRMLKLRPRPHPLQSRSDSEVISPTAMAGGNAGLVLCQVGGQYSGQ